MNNSFANILNCFTGADGGISFVNFKIFVEDIEDKCKEGDHSACEILTIVDRFSKMIDIANSRVEIKTSNKKLNENDYLD